MATYISSDLRVTSIPAIATCDAPAMIFTKAGTRQYLLTPILYAALERHTDYLDTAILAGRLTHEQVTTVSERLDAIRRHYDTLNAESVEKARSLLLAHPDAKALAWVLARYVDRMGGEDAVAELERAAVRGDPWERYRDLDVISRERGESVPESRVQIGQQTDAHNEGDSSDGEESESWPEAEGRERAANPANLDRTG